MMWMVLKALQTQCPEVFDMITWQLCGIHPKNNFSPDFGEVCRTRFNADTIGALVFEAEGRLADEGLLVLARKGRGTWRATIEGRGAHAGGKHQSRRERDCAGRVRRAEDRRADRLYTSADVQCRDNHRRHRAEPRAAPGSDRW
jgi:hypothetical protein